MAGVIQVQQRPDESARGNRNCPWIAECEIEGKSHTARSWTGAPFALARVLKQAGIADAPMTVISAGTKGVMTY